MYNRASDILDNFNSVATTQVLDLLVKNQTKIAWCKDLAATRRYTDMAERIKAITAGLHILKDDLNVKDKVLSALRTIKEKQMIHFVDVENLVIKADFVHLEDTLKVYKNIIGPLEEIRVAQNGLIGQGRLKKLPLPYDELTSTLKQAAANLAKMTQSVASITDYALQIHEKVA